MTIPRRRAVLSGLGIVSSLGIGVDAVEDSLRQGRSGIVKVPEWGALGLKSPLLGAIPGIEAALEAAAISRKLRAALSPAALLAVLAGQQAIASSGIAEAELRSPRTACVVGCGIGETGTILRGGTQLHQGKARRIDPYSILKSMAFGPAAGLVSHLGIGGRSYALSSACSTSTHALGHAADLVRSGAADVVIAGGTEHIDELISAAFHAMRMALSTRFVDRPSEASRPFAADRDGFVLGSGAAVVVVEELEHARARGARPVVEIAGVGATSDPFDLLIPEPQGIAAAAAIEQAIADAGATPADVDYVNAHATGTVAGDLAEAEALRRVFGRGKVPPVSSTKAIGGHGLGAAGAIEAIHCALMLERGFLAPAVHVTPRDPAFDDLELVASADPASPGFVLSTSFGFGGSNAVLALRRVDAA